MRYRRTTKKNMVEKKPKPGKGVQTWKRQESASVPSHNKRIGGVSTFDGGFAKL